MTLELTQYRGGKPYPSEIDADLLAKLAGIKPKMLSDQSVLVGDAMHSSEALERAEDAFLVACLGRAAEERGNELGSLGMSLLHDELGPNVDITLSTGNPYALVGIGSPTMPSPSFG